MHWTWGWGGRPRLPMKLKRCNQSCCYILETFCVESFQTKIALVAVLTEQLLNVVAFLFQELSTWTRGKIVGACAPALDRAQEHFNKD